MSSSLEERLKNNSSAFDGLLSLIPAKYYYDEDTQDQWKAKKKSKEEARQNKKAKLDPNEYLDQGASASEVLKKRAKEAKPVVLPGQKKLSTPQEIKESDDDEKPVKESQQQTKINGKKQNQIKHKVEQQDQDQEEEEEEESINFIFDDEGNEIDFDQKSQSKENDIKSQEQNKKDEESKAEKLLASKLLREKLASKINTLKEKRKAPGSKAAGAPSSREAILEERRKKAELRAEKKRKREELEKGSDDEDEEDEDESDLSEVEHDESVIYQTIQFDENSRATSDLQNLRVKSKKKGPAKKDLKAHLKLIETKKQKLTSLDADKQKEISEREKWNKTIAQAEGVKLRDDEKLLKKALKKKEAQKRKSEIQWRERKDHVENMVSMKQKRREENLQIRKDNKGVKRKNQQKQKRKFKPTSIAPKRAGFEGRMKSGKKK